MNRKSEIGFTLLEVSYWGFYASFLGYATTLLLSRGVSSTAMSLLVAGFMLFSVLGSFFWGSVCDKLRSNKKVLLPSLAAAAGLIWLFYTYAGNVAIIAVIYSAMGFIIQPLSTSIDAWLLRSSKEAPHAYGKIRSAGSLAYALAVLVVGNLMQQIGYQVMLAAGFAFLAMALAAAMILPDKVGDRPTRNVQISPKEIKNILSNRNYLFLILVLFFNSLAAAPVNSLKVVLMEKVGGSVVHVGIDSFVGVMIQVPLIAVAWRIQKLPLRVRYLVMTITPMIMLLCSFFATSPALVIFGTCFTNISFGFVLPTMREVTESNVKPELLNIGHNVTDAVYNSFAGMISMLYAGAIIDSFGIHVMMGICIGIQMIPLCLSLAKMKEGAKEGRLLAVHRAS